MERVVRRSARSGYQPVVVQVVTNCAAPRLRIPRFEPRYDVGDQRNEPPMLRVGPSIVRAGCAPSTGRPQDADRKRAFSAGRSRGLLPAHCLFDQPNDHHQDASSDTAGSDLTDN